MSFQGIKGSLGPPPLCRLLDRGVDLTKAPVEIGDLVGLDVDLRLDVRRLRLETGSSRTALPDMGGNELGIDTRRIDEGEP